MYHDEEVVSLYSMGLQTGGIVATDTDYSGCNEEKGGHRSKHLGSHHV
jgi:hypothetical protein